MDLLTLRVSRLWAIRGWTFSFTLRRDTTPVRYDVGDCEERSQTLQEVHCLSVFVCCFQFVLNLLPRYALDLESKRVWDYVGDGYVHRLLQNAIDGKVRERRAQQR